MQNAMYHPENDCNASLNFSFSRSLVDAFLRLKPNRINSDLHKSIGCKRQREGNERKINNNTERSITCICGRYEKYR